MATTNLATPKQVAFLTKLVGEFDMARLHDLALLDQDTLVKFVGQNGAARVQKREASDLISGLLRWKKSQAPQAPMARPGYYHVDGCFYVVVESKRRQGATYAKQLFTSDNGGRERVWWKYVPGITFKVAGQEPMTLDEAAAYGHLHGHCLVCLKALTDPDSVKRGIGPVCARKFGAPVPVAQAALVTSPAPQINVAALKRRQQRKAGN